MLQTKIKPLILVGCSGSGRSAVIFHLNRKYPHKFERLISHTTRKPRAKQVNNKDFYFVNQGWIKNNSESLVTLTYSINNNYYGLTAQEIKRVMSKNKIPIFKMTLDAYIKNIGKNSKVQINPSQLKQQKQHSPLSNASYASTSSMYLLRDKNIQLPSLKQLQRRLQYSPFSKEQQTQKMQIAKKQHNQAQKYFDEENIIGKVIDASKDQGNQQLDFGDTIMRVQSRLFQLY